MKRKPKLGRPRKLKRDQFVNVVVRMAPQMVLAYDAIATRMGESRSVALRTVLQKFLGQQEMIGQVGRLAELTCKTCAGTGHIGRKHCPVCGGAKFVQVEERLTKP